MKLLLILVFLSGCSMICQKHKNITDIKEKYSVRVPNVMQSDYSASFLCVDYKEVGNCVIITEIERCPACDKPIGLKEVKICGNYLIYKIKP